ncbi:DUF928 domain-containing protein [Chroococcus sp. FPU101]|uniref:DUF928 domain-containing protein n=1 Tax=Chroococcus sp. FPU101 TaxID=1974212 RepID=UPI001A8E0043|nr:DUF928 domain-containing protein [Chroococcus sp. FPU101]GFE69290.1 hypothetical protein CFPU101_19000 [Chroococcus sp. FPU101]
MNIKQRHRPTYLRAIIFLLTLTTLISFSVVTSAQVTSSGGTKLSFTPPPLPNRGLPKGRARGGASRGEMCQTTAQPLTALVPTQQMNSMETVGGLTISGSPSLWFYIPYSLQDDDLVEFVLQDEQQNTVYQTTINHDHLASGVVGVPLAAAKTTLTTDQLYHWYFLVYCEKDNPIFVEGWIQRISIKPELEHQIQQATPRDRIAILAANGIWYDALTQLATLMRDGKPNDTTLIQDWESLLESAGFEIGSQPVNQPNR